MEKMEDRHHKLMEDDPDHFYVFVIGTDPLAKGRGFGSAAMKKLTDRADREGKKCYLENS